MKKIITVLVISLLTSCQMYVLEEGSIINTVQGSQTDYLHKYFVTDGTYFYASAFLYQVGDTVKFKK